MSEKTHYRKAFNSPYLSSADIVEPTILTVSRCVLEADKSKKTRDVFNTIYFKEAEIRKGEKLKPMILNAGNSKMLAHISKSAFIDDWINIKVMVTVEDVKFGREITTGLRIKEVPKHLQQEQKKPTCSDEDFNKMLKFIQDGAVVGGAPMTSDRLRKGRELTEMQLEFLNKIDANTKKEADHEAAN